VRRLTGNLYAIVARLFINHQGSYSLRPHFNLSIHVGDLNLKIYSMMNHVYVDVLKETTRLSHAGYANFDGSAVTGGFTGFVGIGDDKVQVAYTCFKLP
jgi:hypothetical protein